MQTLRIGGMTCGHCERAVTEAVKGLDPTASVRVSLDSGRLTTSSDRPAAELAGAIRDAGYEVLPSDDAPPSSPDPATP